MRRLVTLLISLAIIGVILWKIDRADLAHRFRHLDGFFFSLALACFVPQTLVAAKRWQVLLRGSCDVSLWSATRVILASSTLNVILPSKLGDMAKPYFHSRRGELKTGVGLVLVVIEKLLDVGTLSVFVLLGILSLRERDLKVLACGAAASLALILVAFLFLGEPRTRGIYRLLTGRVPSRLTPWIEGFWADWEKVLSGLKATRGRFSSIQALSLLLWLLHLIQIYLFFLTLKHPVPILLVYALVPPAIFIGLLPISFAGIGTRDSALIYLFAPYASASLMAGVGILTSVRYVVPALFGLPFFHDYMAPSNPQDR